MAADRVRTAVQRTRTGPPFSPPTLLRLHVRDRLANHGGASLAAVFRSNWLLSAYHAVTHTGP